VVHIDVSSEIGSGATNNNGYGAAESLRAPSAGQQ
jgi:hypothetical protein